MIGNRVYDSITGSLPFGRIVEVYGIDASGKTALAKKAGISAQLKNIYKRVVTFGSDNVKRTTYEKLDPDKIDTHVLYIDNEQSFADDNSLTIDGVKADFILGRCDTIGQIFDAIERIVKVVEESAKDTDREQFIFVVIDTIASTSTNQELDQEWGQQDFSRHAKELRAAFRRVSRAINKHNVCLLCINQVSDSFAQKMKKNPNALPDENDYATFGGRALKFYASQRIFVQKVPKKFKLHPDNKLEDGLLIEMKTVKNRVKKPLRKGRMVLLFGDEESAGGGFNEVYSMLETFILLDMAKDESGTISFRFQANGITPSTFESKRANPSIDNRLEWPAFYQEHKVDFDALWVLTEKKIFSSEAQVDALASDDDDDEMFGKKKSNDDDDLI
jgi:RecA/RadA recombinase